MKMQPRNERGMTLLVVLVMLTMITLFVVSMVKLSNTNAVVVGNMQSQRSVEAEAQQAVEAAINSYAFFSDAINNTNSWANSSTASISYSTLWANYTPTGASSTVPTTQSNMTVYRPQCTHAETVSGYSATSNVAPQDTYWDVRVDATDSFTGATIETHQGVKIRLPAGSC
jgi:Tfp pilus assembly protein PilX